MTSITKRCSKCRRHLPLTSFNKNRAEPDGYGTQCRECAHASWAAWKQRKIHNQKVSKRRYGRGA